MALSRKLFLGCAALGVGTPLLALGGGMLWAVRIFGGDSQRLDEEHAAARREGVPLTGEDLRPKVPVPDSENAAIPIRQAMKLWPEGKRRKEEQALQILMKGPGTEAERTAARAALKNLSPVLALAHEAARRSGCDFQYDFNQGVNLLFPEFALTRSMARVLCAEAALADSPEKAFVSIAAAARLSQHAGTVPILIGGLVYVAIGAIAHRQFGLALARFGPAALSHAKAALSAWGKPFPLSHFLGGESVFYHVTAQQLIDGKLTLGDISGASSGTEEGEEKSQGPRIPPVLGPMVVRAWATRGLIYWRGAYKLLRQHEAEPDRAYTEFLAYNTKCEESWKKSQNLQNILLAILTPVYAQAVDKLYLSTTAEQRLRETTLALIEANGKDVPLPPDPFAPNNTPLKLRRTGKGFTLWSVGQDHVDDGGIYKDKSNKVKDMVVTYPGSP